jgi:hypothetical protein
MRMSCNSTYLLDQETDHGVKADELAALLDDMFADPDAAAHPWIERDPATGAQVLRMPLPPPETARLLANALSALADSLRARIA